MEGMVPFPLYETSEMDAPISTKWEELIEIDFKEGDSFLAEPGLGANHISGVLDLFAALVKFESGEKQNGLRIRLFTNLYHHYPSTLQASHELTQTTGYSCAVYAVYLIAEHLHWMNPLQCSFCMRVTLVFT